MRCNHSSLSYIRTSRQDEWRNYTLSMEANFKRNLRRYRKIVTTITVVVVAAIHVVISIVEMFLWQNPLVYQRLDFPADVANQVAPIVQNAGCTMALSQLDSFGQLLPRAILYDSECFSWFASLLLASLVH